MTKLQWIVSGEEAGARLDKFLAAADRLGSRARAARAIDSGKVFVNDVEQTRTGAAVHLVAHDAVRVWIDRPGSAARRGPSRRGELRILYEDRDLLVADKPAGLLAVPLAQRADAPSMYDQVAGHLRSRGKRKPLVVHRIDRDTSGVVLFAKTAAAQTRLKDQFRRHEPERVYLAVVHGEPRPDAGTWRDRLVWDRDALVQKKAHPRDPRASDAVAEYRVVERFRGAALIEVRLRTGKRNQIRLQARLHGHTLVGERLYVAADEKTPPIDFPRQALHALRLAFRHPVDGRPMRFEAPLPPDLTELIERLRRS